MKKGMIACVVVFLFICAVLSVGCTQDNETYDVVCTVFPQYDLCRQIAGEKLKIKMLLPAGTDAHNYQLTISDKMAVKNSKVFVYIGGESEGWVTEILESTDMSGVQCIAWMDNCSLLSRKEDDHDHDHEHEHGHNAEYDEHVYLSVKNAIAFCGVLCEQLCTVFPDKSEEFKQNSQRYVSELVSLDAQYAETLSTKTNKTMYFADRYPFAYLANDYALDCVTPYHGCSTDTEITLKEKTDFKTAYAASGAKGVFVLENGYEDLAKSVTSECGGKIYRVHSCQSLSKEELDSGLRYLDIMRSNLTVLSEALK